MWPGFPSPSEFLGGACLPGLSPVSQTPQLIPTQSPVSKSWQNLAHRGSNETETPQKYYLQGPSKFRVTEVASKTTKE